MRTKTKKIILVVVALIMVFSLNITPVLADWVSFDAVGYFNDILNDLGVDKSELKYNVQTMNVSRQKTQPPQVSVAFNPTDPIPGEKIRAQATPSYFMNETKDLYFTWFLKSADCDEADKGEDKYNSDCDLNNDGRVNIEDYKIKATRIIVNNDFDWERAYENGAYLEKYDTDPNYHDSDRYAAISGGDNQKGKNVYCYVHDTQTGDEYEIKNCENEHLFPNADYQDFKVKKSNGEEKTINLHEDTGDYNFDVFEEQFWHTDPTNNDTAKLGNVDEANVAGLGVDSFTWVYEDGDEVGVVVEGVSVNPTHYADSSYKTMWAMSKNKCDIANIEVNDYPQSTTQTISTTSDSPVVDQTTTITQTTTKDIVSIAGDVATIGDTVTTTTTITNSITGEIISESSVTVPPHTATELDSNDNPYGTSTYSTVDLSQNISTNIKSVSDLNKCLPENLISPTEIGEKNQKLDIKLSYSPKNPLNNPTENSTEGDVLSVQASVLNAKDPAYLKYAWSVYGSNEANPDSWGEPYTKDQLPESSNTNGIGLNSFKFRLNFSDSVPNFLKVRVDVTEDLSNGDQKKEHNYIVIPINSSQDQIHVYPVLVMQNEEGEISINPDDQGDEKEICAKTVSENPTDPVSSFEDNMKYSSCPVFRDEIIALEVDNLNLTDFSWTLDGDPITYKACFFEGCDPEKQTNKAFFPVFKKEGGLYSVELDAKKNDTGDKVHLTRVFKVSEPEIRISSMSEDSCAPKIKGYYVDLDGKEYPDYSDTNFWGLAGSSIALTAQVSGRPISNLVHSWFYNDMAVTSQNASNFGSAIATAENGAEILALDPRSNGENFRISVVASYTQDNMTKKALQRYWGATYDKFYEKNISDKINVFLTDANPNGVIMSDSDKSNKKILANIYSSLPEYFLFLLRIVLSVFVLLLFSSFVLSFFPEIKK